MADRVPEGPLSRAAHELSKKAQEFSQAAHGHPNERILSMGPHDGEHATRAFEMNDASVAQLALVDFVSEKLAQQIVDDRTRRGGFRSWDEVATIPGVHAKHIAELQRAARLTPRES